jgi:predicted 3-demethylubiquinone-9 3-methyltransferase (glyoxalase superfamily)
MTSITPFLWFDNNVPEAVAFYKSVFPNAKVETVNDFMASFELEGQKFNALNGGPNTSSTRRSRSSSASIPSSRSITSGAD